MNKTIASAEAPFVIDCQIFQTFSWNRGMGKYSMELLESVFANELKSRPVTYLFSELAPKNAEAEERLKNISPNSSISYARLEIPKEDRVRHNVQEVRIKNKAVLSDYIRKHFPTKPIFVIMSLYLDEVCPVFPEEGCISDRQLIYYDAIPFLYHERYGNMPGFFDNFYLPHTASLFEADRIMTISKTVANDLHLSFGIRKEKIFNIDGAAIPRAARTPVKIKGGKYKKNQFILMPTGQELRKNNERAVMAFQDYIVRTGSKKTLVITSNFSEEGKEHLRGICSQVDFTGNISESELLWMFQNCSFMLFPPEYEGLGLPVLEAAEQQKVIACSDISVFREMSPTAFVMFDPLDVLSISHAIEESESRQGHVDLLQYGELLSRYTWPETARRFVEAGNAKIKQVNVVSKKRIAVFSPDVSGFSAIGKDIGELHDTYSQYFDIDYYFDKGPNHRSLRPNYLKYAASCYRADEFQETDRARYDELIYHIGNSEYHLHIARVAARFAGFMVLHDTHLNGLYHNLKEWGYITEQREKAEFIFEKAIQKKKRKDSDKSTYIASLINGQKAVVVHSKYAAQAVKAKLIDEKVVVRYLELPFSTPIYPSIIKRSTQEVTIAFAGIIAPVKGLDIMQQIAANPDFKNCRINVFGFSTGDSAQLRDLRDYPNVNVVTMPSDFDFQRLLAASDVMINVRNAYRGETSGSTLSHLRYGGIGVVRDFGWFSELPDDVVVKVESPEDSLPALRGLLRLSEDERSGMSQAALRFMDTHHNHSDYASGMYVLING